MQANASFTKLVVVTRKTMLEELVERHGTRGQARFLAASRGESFDDIEAAHARYEHSVATLKGAIPAGIRTQWIDRGFLPNFLFGPHDLVVTLGADGLVVNVAKYLSTQPILAINPDPSRIDGVLVPVRIDAAAPALAAALAGGIPARRITMARARLDDGQTIDAVNDLFIGIQSHASARYRIEYRRNVENQSSSGVIVSTGAGSTGWYRSVLTAAAGVATAHLGKKAVGNLADRYAFDATARELRFSVREPFTSLSSMGTIICGAITGSETLDIVSQMPTGGVIFSDGMESDFVKFEAGMRARIGIADRCLELLWPAA
jgi:NAD kinase